MKKKNLFIRIMALFLCALMILSIVSILVNVFAAEALVVETGSSDSMVWVLSAACIAVAVAAGCIVSSSGKSKKSGKVEDIKPEEK